MSYFLSHRRQEQGAGKAVSARQANHFSWVLGLNAVSINPLNISYMNFFKTLQVYAGSWNVKDSREFTSEEIESVASAEVVESQFGLSVCLVMKTGGKSYVPLDRESGKSIGDSVDLTQARLMTLGRDGDKDIYRISC